MARFEKGNAGKPKGATGKISTLVKKSLAQLMEGEVERLADEIKKMSGPAYVEYMMALLPYLISKKPAETNLTVSNGNIDTGELKNISLEAKQKIRDILLLENDIRPGTEIAL